MQDNPFVGVWKLVSCNAVRRHGCALPIYGKNPIGRLYYDDHGNMSVQIMKDGRPNFIKASKFHGTPMEMRAAFEGYEAYFSTYAIDREKGVIRHHLIGGLFPNWTDSCQTRYYKFEGNRLVLSTGPIGMAVDHKEIVTLVWERLN